MIVLREVPISDREKLWNVFQKYLHELTAYYPMEMDETGNYSYRYFDAYFEDVGRMALFLYDDGMFVGFAMINDYSCLGNPIDHAMGEFTVFPQYRKRHLGMEAVQTILERFPGRWEIKYCNANQAAARLWNSAAQRYNPTLSSIEDGTESVLSFTA